MYINVIYVDSSFVFIKNTTLFVCYFVYCLHLLCNHNIIVIAHTYNTYMTIIVYVCIRIYMYVYIKLYVSLNGSKLFGHSLFSPLGVGKENCLV